MIPPVRPRADRKVRFINGMTSTKLILEVSFDCTCSRVLAARGTCPGATSRAPARENTKTGTEEKTRYDVARTDDQVRSEQTTKTTQSGVLCQYAVSCRLGKGVEGLFSRVIYYLRFT